MNEIWKPVLGLEGRYEVSNIGGVRSLMYRNRNTQETRETPLILKPTVNRGGYHTVHLERKTRWVHRLVLEAFVCPRPEGMQTGHLNGVRDDNRVENLKWVTEKENASHRKIHGTQTAGANHATAKLTEKQVYDIFQMRLNGKSLQEIADFYSLDQGGISMILLRKSWKHLNLPKLSGIVCKHVGLKSNQKLSEKDIPVIHKLRKDGISSRKLATKFNVHISTIDKILCGTLWKSAMSAMKEQSGADKRREA